MGSPPAPTTTPGKKQTCIMSQFSFGRFDMHVERSSETWHWPRDCRTSCPGRSATRAADPRGHRRSCQSQWGNAVSSRRCRRHRREEPSRLVSHPLVQEPLAGTDASSHTHGPPELSRVPSLCWPMALPGVWRRERKATETKQVSPPSALQKRGQSWSPLLSSSARNGSHA